MWSALLLGGSSLGDLLYWWNRIHDSDLSVKNNCIMKCDVAYKGEKQGDRERERERER